MDEAIQSDRKSKHKKTMKTRGSCGEAKNGETEKSLEMREKERGRTAVKHYLKNFEFSIRLQCKHKPLLSSHERTTGREDSERDLALVRNSDEVP